MNFLKFIFGKKKNLDRVKFSFLVFNDLKKFDIYYVYKWLVNVRF